MKILAIDTSCDETSVAILDNLKVLSSVIASQVQLHKKWGGVVPGIARRAHEQNIEQCYKEAMKRARLDIAQIDAVAVTKGPGLAIALEIGIEFARKIALENQIPLIPVNHIEAHLFSSLLQNRAGKSVVKYDFSKLFPALGVVLSGSHTDLILVEKIGQYKIIGETLDDAVGEAFDKVARMLNLGYPGGEIITKLAQQYRQEPTKIPVKLKESIKLPIPMLQSPSCDFSYSGLKTACLYKIEEIREQYPDVKESLWGKYFCSQFINAVSESIRVKAKKALELNPEVRSMLVGGGVVNNRYIMRILSALAGDFGLKFLYPEKRHRGDNAAMIGGLAYLRSIEMGSVRYDDAVIKLLDRDPSMVLE